MISGLLICISCVLTAAKSEQNVLSSCIDRSNSKVYSLQCPNNGMIVNIDYKSGTGTCTNQVCLGDAPSLLIDMLSCYWQPQCNVPLPNGFIVKPGKEYGQEDLRCMGRPASFLHVEGYQCFNANKDQQTHHLKDVFDICGNTDTKAVSQGIIRSHADYPWEYTSEALNYGTDCSLTLTTLDNKTLAYTVLAMDLDTDFLKVSGRAMQTARKGQSSAFKVQKVDGSLTDVVFKFSIQPLSNGGKGFIICFKFYDKLIPAIDVCEDITQGGLLETHKSDSEPLPFLPSLFGDDPDVTSKPSRPGGGKGCKRKRRKGCKKGDGKNGKNNRKRGKKNRNRGKRQPQKTD